MKKIFLTVVLCGFSLAGGGSALANEAADNLMESKIRKTAIGIGNAWVCVDKDKREVFREEATQLFDLILQDVGSDLAFTYAASLGYGSGQAKETLDCPVLLEQWEGIRADYKLRVDM